MPKFLVKKNCYYAEQKVGHPKFIEANEVYVSDTLRAEDAPSYFELIKHQEHQEVDGISEPPTLGDAKEMNYQELKTFVIDNGIDVIDFKKETLEKAVNKFIAKATDEQPLENEGVE